MAVGSGGSDRSHIMTEENTIDANTTEGSAVEPSEHTYETLYRNAIRSVVSVYVTPGRSDRARGGAGSGFVYRVEEGGAGREDSADEFRTGHVVTNQHVVGGASEVELRFSEGDWRTGSVVGRDTYTDLAVVRVSDLPDYADALPMAEENPTPGQRVAALGNPMGLDGTITTGVVSGTNRSMPTGNGFAIPDTVQTDAAINPGNSGGPLVDLHGRVVGVNRAKGGDNIGFAVSTAIATRVLPALVAEGAYRHSYLKVQTYDVSPAVAEANGLEEPRGVLVVDVSLGPSSGALLGSTGSVRVRGREVPVGGDVIVGVNGHPVRSHEELLRYLITETEPGEEVTVDLVRDGERLTERLTLGERPADTGRRGGRRIRVQ